MDTKINNPLFGTRTATKATLLSAAFLLSACGEGGGSDPSWPEPLPEKGSPGEIGSTLPLTPKEQQIRGDVRAATVQITAVGDWILPRGLTSVDVQKRSSGTGFFIDDTGYIVTNNHVVTGAGRLTVNVKDVYIPYPVELVGVAECEDLAVLKTTVGNSGFDALQWSETPPGINMKIGASGFPSDVSSSVTGESIYTFTDGIINTDVRLNNTTWASTIMFNHSARTAPGSSGGPVVDMKTGDVIGVHYASTGDRFMAISSTEAKRIVDTIIGGNDVLSIGISAKVVFRYTDKSGNGGLAFARDIPEGATAEPFGVWVNGLEAGGKAKTIGIQSGDIITSIGGVKLQYDPSDDLETRRSKSTMGVYCGVLRSNNPNKGTVLDIEIYRPKAGGVTCAGEINGQSLALKENPAIACPSRPANTESPDEGSPKTTKTDSTVVSGSLCCADYQSEDGEFEGRYMDMYTLYTSSEGEVTVEMKSTSLDSYLLIGLMSPDGETVEDVYFDDDSGSGWNAKVTFHKLSGREYVILATSAGPEETGPYTLHFRGFGASELPGGHRARVMPADISLERLLHGMGIH